MAFTFSQCADEYIQNIGINPEDAARLIGGRNLIKQALAHCTTNDTSQPKVKENSATTTTAQATPEEDLVSLEENSRLIAESRAAREEQQRIWEEQAAQRSTSAATHTSFADEITNETSEHIPTMSIAQAAAAVKNATTFGDFQQKMSLDDAQQIAIIAQQSPEFRSSPEGEKFLSILDKRPSLYFENDVSSNDLETLKDSLVNDDVAAATKAAATIHHTI